MPKNSPRTGTLKSMGLRLWLDTFYYKMGGWVKFVELMQLSPKPDHLDQLVAEAFGRSRPAAREWRLLYEADPTGTGPVIDREATQ
jgi:hypothetical protein